MAHFTEDERTTLFNRILQIAKLDERVCGGALLGSLAIDKQDKWSDIDISFSIHETFEPKTVLDEWTKLLKAQFDIIDYWDLPHANAIYRVMLFANGLELDLSVVPESEFGPKAPTFKLLFGKALEKYDLPKPNIAKYYGLGWHHVLHANSAIKRGKFWQAEYWISHLREIIITMKCIRLGLPTQHGRGADRIPKSELNELNKTIIKSIEKDQLKTALTNCTQLLVKEIAIKNDSLALKLLDVFTNAFNEK